MGDFICAYSVTNNKQLPFNRRIMVIIIVSTERTRQGSQRTSHQPPFTQTMLQTNQSLSFRSKETQTAISFYHTWVHRQQPSSYLGIHDTTIGTLAKYDAARIFQHPMHILPSEVSAFHFHTTNCPSYSSFRQHGLSSPPRSFFCCYSSVIASLLDGWLEEWTKRQNDEVFKTVVCWIEGQGPERACDAITDNECKLYDLQNFNPI